MDEPSIPARHVSSRQVFKVAIAFGVLLFGVWVAGLLVFVLHRPQLSFSFPVLQAHPASLHNLALYRYGTSVRVSSFDLWSDSQHHPGFLVDGLKNETVDQKWASLRSDTQPWVELRWNHSATLERIVIRHAGAIEEQGYTARDYLMTCLLANANGPTLKISGNELPATSHDLKCVGAKGVRITFGPNRQGDVVRVFEVEAWGTPEGTQ